MLVATLERIRFGVDAPREKVLSDGNFMLTSDPMYQAYYDRNKCEVELMGCATGSFRPHF